ncbi:MAG: MBL fold metallo-hydrolase [Longimicrobiales bacterium]
MGQPQSARVLTDTPVVPVTRLGPDTALVDILHQGHRNAIGTGVFESSGGVGLVDPGPTACLEALRSGLGTLGYELSDVRAVFLTHIHLDHATAAGAIVRESPEALVYVHPRGARHMIDPAKLLASAGRIYGDAMDSLWGEFVPVPEASVREVDEGDRVQLGDRSWEVGYVPGHAKHHVAYYEAEADTAWIGDVGGIRMPGGVAVPVTPPPDIDVEAWTASMARVLAWGPKQMVPTHFGVVEDPADHFLELNRRLVEWAEWVKESLGPSLGSEPDDSPDRQVDQEKARQFAEWLRADLTSSMSEDLAEAYALAFGFEDSWWGLARYWRKWAEG